MGYAESEENKFLIDQMKKAALNEVVTDLSKKIINEIFVKQVGNKIAEEAAKKTLTPGDKVFAGIGIYNGLNEVIDAKNDKQKAFGSAQMGASALTLAIPPAGAIASVALLVIRFADGLLDIRSSIRIAEYTERMIRSFKEIVELKTKLIQADFSVLESYDSTITKAKTVSSNATLAAKEACKIIVQESSLGDVENCLNKTQEKINTEYIVLLHLKNLVLYSFSETRTWEILEKNKLGSRAGFKAEADAIEANISDQQKVLSEHYAAFHKATAELAIKSIRDKNSMVLIEQSMGNCSRVFDHFAYKAALASDLLKRRIVLEQYDSFAAKMGNMDLKTLLIDGESIQNSECFEISDQDIDMNSRILSIQYSEFKNAKKIFHEVLGTFESLVPDQNNF
jgi:hypothetical protein